MDDRKDPSKRTAIHQDTVNGLNDPMPWPVRWWATAGDTLWTACRARAAGVDALGLYYGPGDIIVHQHTLDAASTKVTKGFTVTPRRPRDPVREIVKAIGDWNDGLRPERTGTVRQAGRERLSVPETGRTPSMGWSQAVALADTAMRRLDQRLVCASLLQNGLDRVARPCVWFLEANGYDLNVIPWRRDGDGRYRECDFLHLQYDDITMSVNTIAHSRQPYRIAPQALDGDGLMERSRAIRDAYQRERERDGGFTTGMGGRQDARCGAILEGDRSRPLLEMDDGCRAPEWDGLVDAAARDILADRTPIASPALPQPPDAPRAAGRDAADGQESGTEGAGHDTWPNMWVANRCAYPYTLHARDGRDWDKMIVTLPRGTLVDGRDMGGWCVDCFMRPANRRQKDSGGAVNMRLRPDSPVELFRGRGRHRQTTTVHDPATLARAVADAQRVRNPHALGRDGTGGPQRRHHSR